MITSEKIDEWLQEAEERPESAALILQFIANRLRDLSARNEELREENIALLTEKRVEEYERRIAHLEYQLELLKRQLSGEVLPGGELEEGEGAIQRPVKDVASILVYDDRGHVLRGVLSSERLLDDTTLGRLRGLAAAGMEQLRLLVVPPAEELMFLFSSGRIATLPVTSIAALSGEAGVIAFEWGGAEVPAEPRSGESLVCVAPISRLALAEYFVQASRRGYVKKIRSALAESILANHYIGSGVKLPADRSFELALCGGEDRLALVSQSGRLLLLEVKSLPFAIEEAMRLEAEDHLVAAFVANAGATILVMTQIGKVIQLAEERLEPGGGMRTKGQAVFSQQRRQKGVRVVGASAAGEGDWGIALHQDGELTLHAVGALCGAGVIQAQGDLLAFSTFTIGAA